MIQKGHTDSFNTGSYAQDQTREPMDKVANRSKLKEANKIGTRRGTDGLFNALGAPEHMYTATHKANLPTDNHEYRPSSRVHPTGVHYHPAGEFGVTHRTGAGRGVYGYGGNRHSARPSNAIGNPPERHGGNAVGVPPNRHGSNAVPGHENRAGGQNAVGHAPNRYGENALASTFRPRFGKPHGHRV